MVEIVKWKDKYSSTQTINQLLSLKGLMWYF